MRTSRFSFRTSGDRPRAMLEMRRTDADGLLDSHFHVRRDVRDVLGDATITTTSRNQPDPQYEGGPTGIRGTA